MKRRKALVALVLLAVSGILFADPDVTKTFDKRDKTISITIKVPFGTDADQIDWNSLFEQLLAENYPEGERPEDKAAAKSGSSAQAPANSQGKKSGSQSAPSGGAVSEDDFWNMVFYYMMNPDAADAAEKELADSGMSTSQVSDEDLYNMLFSSMMGGGYGGGNSSVGINEKGMTVETRFDVPEGYERVSVKAGSQEDFYRKLPLKPAGTDIYYYDGTKKNSRSHAAVLDFPQLSDDLLQCADACMKMRAEYLYSIGAYDKISFKAESGVAMPFSKYVDGYRLTGSGWKSGYAKGASRKTFDEYLRIVYSYASTRSMAKEVVPIKIKDLRIGDVFVQSGNPGHSVFVADMAVNKKTGQKIMLLGQGYMPAQDLHIVQSFESISPWFTVKDDGFSYDTYSFPRGCQGRWPE